MGAERVTGSKSTVTRIDERTIRKVYRTLPPEPGLDPVIHKPAFPQPDYVRFGREAGMLRVLSDIPDGERLTPQFYRAAGTSALEMEYIPDPTVREALSGILKDKGTLHDHGYPDVVQQIPVHVAAIHRQLEQHREELLQRVRGNSGMSYLRFRSKRNEWRRLERYIQTIVYSMSPDLEGIRAEGRRHPSIHTYGKITDYIRTKGITLRELMDSFATEAFTLLYDAENPKPTKRAFLQGTVRIVAGDLGPQHLCVTGRYFDLDNARIASPVVDLTSALYNVFTQPVTEAQEIDLLGLSMVYLEHFLERTPTEEERRKFTARLTTARLRETIRLFAADCRLTIGELRHLTRGHPTYDALNDEQLRPQLLQTSFVDGFNAFLQFWRTSSSGILDPADALIVYDQMAGVLALLEKTRVLQGATSANTLESLEAIVAGKR